MKQILMILGRALGFICFILIGYLDMIDWTGHRFIEPFSYFLFLFIIGDYLLWLSYGMPRGSIDATNKIPLKDKNNIIKVDFNGDSTRL